MASHAAMLLDPRAYKKKLQKNGTGQQGTSNQQRSPAPPIAPPGTSSVAHRLLSPQRPRAAQRPHSNPRSQNPSSGGSTSTTSSPRTQGQMTPDIDFQFANTSGLEIGDGKRSMDLIEVDDDVVLRHNNLIEDMYGVQRRTGIPYKRLKADNDTTRKTSMGPISGNTGLGEYMKEDDGEKSSSTAVTPDVVDLTLDPTGSNDDDDLQVTGSNNLSVQRVCYGKLENAMIQATLVPKPDPKTQSIFGDSAHDWPSIRLGVHRQAGQGNNRIDVSDPHGKMFGAVDAKTAAVIVPLLDSPAMKVDITARLDVRKKMPFEVPWTPCSALYRASINLYGLRQDVERVGNHLGQNNVWLATPFSVEQGVPVFNPHAERRRLQPSWAPAGLQRNRPAPQYEVRSTEEVTDAVMKMFDQLQSADNLPEMEPPSLVLTPLLRHQKQALWFMTEKENPRKFGPNEEDNNSLWRVQYRPNGAQQFREIISGTLMDQEPPQSFGGLLADMMGLGKTLSILSLVVSSLTAARQWASMIPPPELVRDQPGIRNTKTTLMVVPLSTVNNWVTQIKEHLQTDALSYYVFHGSARTNNVDELSKYDLVITTYSIVLSELQSRSSKRAGLSPLLKMNMFRIVLDEAHTIREQNAAQTKAIFRLQSQRRWSVTGTPIQNRLDDLFSVTKFIGLCPYDNRNLFNLHILSRFKTGDASVLASLRVLVDSFTLRRVKDKIDLPTRHDKIIMLEFTESERHLHEFFRKESNVMMRVIAGEDKNKMKGRMYHHILKAMMILRQISAHGKELLDNEERARIKGMSAQDAIDLEEGASEGAGAADKKAYEMFTLMQESSADTCAVCSKRLEEPNVETNGAATPSKSAPIAIILPCFDVLCPDCFSGSRQEFERTGSHDIKCSVCDGWIPALYSTITTAGLQDYLNQQAYSKQSRKQAKTLGEYEGPHTKTRALISHLLDTAEESSKLPAGEPPIKSVVFSAWTSHLDLIEIALRDNGLTSFTRLDGTMTLAARNKALDSFRDDNSITILLATIGAGGVGLNLTAASHVYIMEPQYNPAAVAQAIDRVHRLGQTREVTTVQFLMKESIEEKIFELAKKKQQLADMSLSRGKLDKAEVQEKRMREYRGLFK
ncbi:Putative Helicase-like transcription factor HLTF/DNA helicase RAD5, DEAD-box superfamily [Aspergillus calidoustus]|uniref:Putative Helicase-like transcription factor HLTF/DNA helicase RAD5, DEAD-box superfamily n=1 Tax=Aspergillus calidoustus TaxID=454130 RepID=A0A0U5FMS0_ASPCI|nr:Putative Helicase-like transcription factor HLTF/DNA helicase RAD5, DEAD-box superfamily [Aspergillus calidoustus]